MQKLREIQVFRVQRVKYSQHAAADIQIKYIKHQDAPVLCITAVPLQQQSGWL